MSWKSVQREPGCSMQKGRWTQDEAKTLFAILRTRLKTLAVWYEQSYLNSDDVTPIRAIFKCRQLPWAVYITAKLVKTFDIPQQNYWRSVVADNDAMWLRSQAASRDRTWLLRFGRWRSTSRWPRDDDIDIFTTEILLTNCDIEMLKDYRALWTYLRVTRITWRLHTLELFIRSVISSRFSVSEYSRTSIIRTNWDQR